MKVAMVNTAKNRGGAARMALTLAKGIRSVDSTISVDFYHCDDKVNQGWIKGLKRPCSREVNALLSRFGGARMVYDSGVANQIIKDSQDADILHIHNLHGYYLNYEKLLETWKKKPVVWTWHDMWAATGRCGVSFDCDGWQSGCIGCPHKEFYPAAWVDVANKEFQAKTRLYEKLEKLLIVSPSDWLREIALKRGFLSTQTYTVPNPVDLHDFKPFNQYEAKKNIGLNDKKYVLFIAADCNNKKKGYEDFLEIINRTKLNGIVVGKPPEKKSSRIFYAGTVSSSENLSKYYSVSEVMIMTSKLDNYPNTVIESMACGTPVLGYAVGGIPSQMPGFWDGVVPAFDVIALSDKVKNYINNGGKTNHLQQKFRLHAENNFSPDAVSKEYIDLYHLILN